MYRTFEDIWFEIFQLFEEEDDLCIKPIGPFIWGRAREIMNKVWEDDSAASGITFENFYSVKGAYEDDNWCHNRMREIVCEYICDLLGDKWDYTEDLEKCTTTFFDTSTLTDDPKPIRYFGRNPEYYHKMHKIFNENGGA